MFNPQIYENSRADGIGVLEVVGDGDQPRFVPLKQTILTGALVGPLADLRLRQVFGYARTVCDQVLEAVYRFPLPGDAAVSGVTVRFGEVEIVAELKAREQAEAAYAEAKQAGRQATLTTRESPNVFTLQVAGIQPDQDIVVETSFVQLARVEGAAWTIRVPLTTPPRYVRSDELNSRHAQGQPLAVLRDPGHRFALDIIVHNAATVTSPTHALAVNPVGDEQRVQLQSGEVLPDRDCVLAWTPVQAETRPVLRVFCHSDRPTDWVYFLAQVAPPALPTDHQGIGREAILLVDHSGSMTGPKWAAADWAVERFLADLTERDTFALGVFHNTTHWFAEQLQPATSAVVEKAVQWLKQHTDSGGTELGVALEQALNLPRTAHNDARHILILTDAAVTDAARILRLADQEAKQVQRRRISVLCIDAAPNAFLALELAERGGGVARFLTSEPDQEDITTALDEVLADWAAPALAGLRLGVNRTLVEVSGREVATASDAAWRLLDLGDLPSGRALWVAGRIPHTTNAELLFRLQLANGAALAAASVSLVEAPVFPALKALFGARRINGLEYLMNAGYHGPQLVEQLTRLGYDAQTVLGKPAQKSGVYIENVRTESGAALRALLVQEALTYHLASAETSFVAVRSEAGERVKGTVAVANALPSGWSGEFVRASAAPLMAGRALGAQTVLPSSLPRPANAPVTGFVASVGKVASSLMSHTRAMAAAPSPSIPARGQVVIFVGTPPMQGVEACLFDSAQVAGKMPEEVVIQGIQARLLDGANQPPLTARSVNLLLFVGDLAAPRAKIRLVDLLRQGPRPLNVLRRAGQVVRLVLQDPNGLFTQGGPALEVTLQWQ
ncbi:MAG: VIT domain-containing protein [Caldilineaceae bacterium]